MNDAMYETARAAFHSAERCEHCIHCRGGYCRANEVPVMTTWANKCHQGKFERKEESHMFVDNPNGFLD